MSSQLYFLTNVTGVDEIFNFSGHSGPVVGGANSIVSFKITSMRCFGNGVMRFLHDFGAEVFRHAKS